MIRVQHPESMRGATPEHAPCPECFEEQPAVVGEDLDVWDAWSVLGDVGGREPISEP
jgi:hypothetical protein